MLLGRSKALFLLDNPHVHPQVGGERGTTRSHEEG